ncbi:MAG: hypothetical protein JWQ38_3483 [Flavipsychrobacter sp.]|nr:hypothetical protein [Flavipsychrobacter sp.]
MRLLITTILILSMTISAGAQKYVFYLHGRIVEEMGANAVETTQGFGAYEYEHILRAFRKENFTVISEVRAKNTDPKAYAHKVGKQIDSLLKTGVQPGNITVVGASKGSTIAMYASTFLKNKNVNFVFMAGCFDDVATSMPDINFCGNILSIYEESDAIGRSCASLKNKAVNGIPHYQEIELHTGLKHGFLYKPLKEWVTPAVKWANGNYQ